MNEWERVLALLLDKSKELSPKTKKKKKVPNHKAGLFTV